MKLLFLLHIMEVGEDYLGFVIVITVFCFVTLCTSLYYTVFPKQFKIETAFLLAFIPFGLVYNFVITPYAPPDEIYHITQTTRTAGYLLEVAGYEDNFNSTEIHFEGSIHHYNSKEAYKTVMNGLFAPDDSTPDSTEIIYSYSYPVQHLPGTIGLLIGKILPINNVLLFYFGRLFNLAFAAVILYFSVKIIPVHKMTILVISMFPMFLQQSASYSYDAFINSMSILLVSLLLREILSVDKLKLSRYVLIVVVAMLLAPAKYVYSLFILLIFLVPPSNFRSKGDYVFKTLIAAGLVFATAVVHYILTVIPAVPGEPNWEGFENYNNLFIIQNPIKTVRIFAETTILKMHSFVAACIGGLLCGWTMPVNVVLIVLFLVLFVSCVFLQADAVVIDKKLRVFLSVIVFAVYVGVLYSMFVGWTSNYSTVIVGVQGRYFLPLCLPVAVIFSIRVNALKRGFDRYICMAPVLLNTLVVFDVINKTLNLNIISQ